LSKTGGRCYYPTTTDGNIPETDAVNLVILTSDDSCGGDRFAFSDHRAVHIRSVLRAEPGRLIRVGMVNGRVGTAEVASVDDSRVELICRFDTDPPVIYPAVDIICAVPRPKTIRKILVIAAMMGVRRLMFVRANRTDKSYLSSPLLTSEGWRPHLLEGLAQGGLTRLPQISIHPLFRPFVEDQIGELLSGEEKWLRLLSDPKARQNIAAVCGDCDNCHIVAAVGPEGGWVPFELGLLEQQGFVRFSLGPWTLRVETAVTAILAQLQLVSSGQR
jgi:RsmE family RNA methyltransferase